MDEDNPPERHCIGNCGRPHAGEFTCYCEYETVNGVIRIIRTLCSLDNCGNGTANSVFVTKDKEEE